MFFTDQQLADLTIERMVFHLVGPNEESFVRLQEFAPGQYQEFFLERIRSVNGGIPYRFSNASATRTRLQRIAEDHEVFQDESEELARDFQNRHGGSAAAGAFLIFSLRVGQDRAYALLKYDDETVLSYEFEENEDGDRIVTLDSIERTFVQSRDALQKSALIRLTDEDGELTVLDRQNQQKVARYFENFLDARRQFNDADLTQRLVKVTRAVIKENRGLVSEEVSRNVHRRTYEAAAQGGNINAENQKSFLESVVGRPLEDADDLVMLYRRALNRERIENVPVRLDPTDVRAPASERIKTANDIRIRVPNEMRDAVIVEEDRVVIRDRVIERTDDT